MTTYIVEFTKTFKSGNLKDIAVPSTVSFPTLERAQEYVEFLNKHATVPYEVSQWAGTGSWLCTNSKIKVVNMY